MEALGGEQRHMRECVGEIQEERPLMPGANELHRLLGVAARELGLIRTSLEDLLVVHQRHLEVFGLFRADRILWRVLHAVHVLRIGNAKIGVETMRRGQKLRQVPEMPFAHHSGGVAGLLQGRGDGDFRRGQAAGGI